MDRTGKDRRVISGQRVLVVDGQSETEEVLRAVLEPRGCRVDSVRGDSPDQTVAPDPRTVVVLHQSRTGARYPHPAGTSDGETARPWGTQPQVIIGSIRQPGRPAERETLAAECAPGSRYLTQPFHYGELVQAIEELLQSDGTVQGAAAG